MDVKKVACLYRASAEMGADPDEDITKQKEKCQKIIRSMPSWKVVGEYFEKDIPKDFQIDSFQESDIMRQIIEDASARKFDILLMSEFNKLGERLIERVYFLVELLRKETAIFAADTGEINIKNADEILQAYIMFKIAERERERQSMRVYEKHKEMVRSGMFRGGIPPYGYNLVDSGVINKNGKSSKKVAINEEEARVVKLIYDLALKSGMRGSNIAKYLNEHGIRTRTGIEWTGSAVNSILSNPMYKGYMTFGKTINLHGKRKNTSPGEWVMSDKIKELVIIPEELWDKVQELIKVKKL